MERGPGGNEPQLIEEAMLAGLSFDAAVAKVEAAHYFKCADWWKDLNREVLTEKVAEHLTDPTK